MPISLTFHGAARSVTGSCIQVQAGTTQLLIDCGVAQDNDADEYAGPAKFPFDPSMIDAVILTHGHLDHTGKIPQLVRAGFKGTIYGHYATCVPRCVTAGEWTSGTFYYKTGNRRDVCRLAVARIPGSCSCRWHKAG